MKNRDVSRHPGIMRVMKVDSEFAGLLLAAAFLVMGAVGLDIGKYFVLGTLGLGVGVAVLLRFHSQERLTSRCHLPRPSGAKARVFIGSGWHG